VSATKNLGCALVLLALGGCGEPVEVDDARFAVATPGPWVIPAETLAVGDTQYVDYTGAGPWVGESGCGGDFLPGTRLLQDWLYANFPQVWHIGGYSCRPINGNPDVMSVHATGRAIDVHIYTIDGEADNELGDPIGNYLIEHAEEMGIQLIIWDRWKWNASRSAGDKDGYYSGAHPHNDHLHVELSVAAANLELPWYSGPMDPPDLPPCGVIPREGGIVDDADACAQAFGPAQYWRVVEGEGYGGRLLWTNAFESTDPSNWARYSLELAEAGTYEVEYYSTSAYAVYDAVDYQVVHAGETTTLSVDQAGLDGWVSIGRFEFAAGGAQSVSVLDTAGPVGDDQHIIYDAIRLTRVEDGGAPQDPDPGDDPPDPGSDPSPEPQDPDGAGELAGGCSAAGGGSAPGALALLVALALAAPRRRRY